MVSTTMHYPEQHHPALYFDDGNVVLSAISKDGKRCYFRVHQSVLCRHSPVFEEMFQIPPLREDTPEHEIAESYDGVPHIQMPDSAEDVGSLIGVLYDPLGSAYKRYSPNTPVLVHGTLKLAIKYECEALRARIVENLESDWPQTLVQWDARRQEAAVARSEHYLQQAGKINGMYLDDRLPEPASAIRIASDFNIPSILPAAFYQLSLISTEADWDKYRARPSTEGKNLRFGGRTARWNLLERTDLMRLVHGQKCLTGATRAIGTDIFGTRCPRNSQGCSKARSDCWRYIQQNSPVSIDDPLEILRDCMSLHDFFRDLPCASCTADIAQSAEKKRREIWQGLPGFFNLK